MFKTVQPEVWAFDAEWVPDPAAGRILYDLPDSMSDREVMGEIWKRNGATGEEPRPFLKIALCRIVSIAMVMRRTRPDGAVSLDLRSQPKDPQNPDDRHEGKMLSRFLDSVGRRGPQLVGYNSAGADLPIIYQRAIIKGLSAKEFCARPEKPWEGRDYFGRDSGWHVDLMQLLTPWRSGRNTTPSLDTLATLSGVPAKVGGYDGSAIADSWLDGDLARIVRYNELDAVTTYLVWLRVAHFGGHFTTEQYRQEQVRVREMLEQRCEDPKNEHLMDYVNEWDRLEAALAKP